MIFFLFFLDTVHAIKIISYNLPINMINIIINDLIFNIMYVGLKNTYFYKYLNSSKFYFRIKLKEDLNTKNKIKNKTIVMYTLIPIILLITFSLWIFMFFKFKF